MARMDVTRMGLRLWTQDMVQASNSGAYRCNRDGPEEQRIWYGHQIAAHTDATGMSLRDAGYGTSIK